MRAYVWENDGTNGNLSQRTGRDEELVSGTDSTICGPELFLGHKKSQSQRGWCLHGKWLKCCAWATLSGPFFASVPMGGPDCFRTSSIFFLCIAPLAVSVAPSTEKDLVSVSFFSADLFLIPTHFTSTLRLSIFFTPKLHSVPVLFSFL
jgi:hypothetical protein